MRPSLKHYSKYLQFLLLTLAGCGNRGSNHIEPRIFGTWIVESGEIDDKSGAFPANMKSGMEEEVKGQVYVFGVDSTLTIKDRIGKGSETAHFTVSKADGRTYISIPGADVARPMELQNLTKRKMDLVVDFMATYTLHLKRQ